jgi:nicotinate-nucleotide adenylyltransferase
MRIGLYGGSFDPVHLGHLLVAEAACEELRLDRIVFIPAARSPFKPGHAPAPDHLRLRWLRIALAGHPEFEVDDLELRRGGTSYSIDTVRACATRFPGATLHWLIGADHVPTLSQWRDAHDLAALIDFIVIPRPGAPTGPGPEPFRLHPLRGWPLGVSSSEIRERIRTNRPVDHLLPPHVTAAMASDRAYLPQQP